VTQKSLQQHDFASDEHSYVMILKGPGVKRRGARGPRDGLTRKAEMLPITERLASASLAAPLMLPPPCFVT
jgi:hypothetical protein